MTMDGTIQQLHEVHEVGFSKLWSSFAKGSTINDLGGGGKIENEFIFSAGLPFEFFFRKASDQFFPCMSLIFFLSIWPPPQMINGQPPTTITMPSVRFNKMSVIIFVHLQLSQLVSYKFECSDTSQIQSPQLNDKRLLISVQTVDTKIYVDGLFNWIIWGSWSYK